MVIVEGIDALRSELRARRGTVGFAPTMGYLHEGHVSLFHAARRENDVAVASIFVNPLQFGANEDLDAYPRDPEGDAEKAQRAGIDILWMPTVAEMYPEGSATRVRVEGLTDGLCGRSRPTHFEGVTTVVTKLFHAVRPDRAYFGQKDYQQLAVIRRMTKDLDFGIEITGLPIHRHEDGLAMSSRNAYLTSDDRARALVISQTLRTLRSRWADGERDALALALTLAAGIEAGGLRLDYAEVLDGDTLLPVAPTSRRVVAVTAAWSGRTRLLDNTVLSEPDATLDLTQNP